MSPVSMQKRPHHSSHHFASRTCPQIVVQSIQSRGWVADCKSPPRPQQWNLRKNGCGVALQKGYRLSVISYFFPNSVSFGVFSHSKGSGAGRSSQIRWEPGSLEGSLEEVPFTRESLGARSAWHKVGNRVPRKKFPSKVSQQGSPEPVPKQGFPARGSQAKFLSKVPRNRFPSKGSQQEVPKQGSH